MFYNAPTVSKQGVKSENSAVALCAHTDYVILRSSIWQPISPNGLKADKWTHLHHKGNLLVIHKLICLHKTLALVMYSFKVEIKCYPAWDPVNISFATI